MAASKQARTLTHLHNAVLLVWGSLRLATINVINCLIAVNLLLINSTYP